MRILVVEDELGSARLLSVILERSGHEVVTEHDGRSGLARAKSFQPDAVISDIGLPQLNGYELAAELRRDEQFKHSLLIAVSGYGQPSDKERAKAAGFDHHMTKPCDIEQLKALLAAAT